jgi:hypothetical protein
MVIVCFLLPVAAGNLSTSAMILLRISADGVSPQHGATYFWFFASIFARLDDPLVTALAAHSAAPGL